MDNRDYINRNIIEMKQYSAQYTIYFVVNVVGKTKSIDYKEVSHSILTEYLTENEYDVMINALKKCGFKIKIFNNEIDFINYINANIKNIDLAHIIVFNLARNGKGLNKKALIPAFCQLQGLLMTGSDAYHVCLGRHKFHVNCILSSKMISVPKTWCFTELGWLFNDIPDENTTIIIKPAYESASRGVSNESISFYNSSIEKQILMLQQEYEQDILVQEFISGYEVQVPVIELYGKPCALMSVGISMQNDMLLNDKIITYDIAYDETYSFFDYAKLDKDLSNQIMNCAEKAFLLLGMKHYGRFDFRITTDGKFFITDISTHPFLIKHSSYAFMFDQLGFKYEDMFLLLAKLVVDSEEIQ